MNSYSFCVDCSTLVDVSEFGLVDRCDRCAELVLLQETIDFLRAENNANAGRAIAFQAQYVTASEACEPGALAECDGYVNEYIKRLTTENTTVKAAAANAAKVNGELTAELDWFLRRETYMSAIEAAVAGYPQALTELYTWLQDNPKPGAGT